MSSKNKNSDSEVFRRAMADVKPLPRSERLEPVPLKPPARAFQQELDDREALEELMAFDDPDGIETGEELLWAKPGVQPRVLKRLRRGYYSVADTIDLHHMDVETAKSGLLDFIENALHRNYGCVRVIHGKGLRSRDLPRLKVMTNRMLYKHPRVIAYASCRPVDGGTGATDVLLSAPPPVQK